MRKSFGDVLRENGGIAPGVDFARIALAVSVLAWHVPETIGAERIVDLPVLWLLYSAALPMFFGLSGFLISASAARLKLRDFALNRGARIVPALFVEVMLSALILGPTITEFSYSQYFSSPQFWQYFLNLIGFIHYRLPGVFISNPNPTVNGSLWTIPFEILCYVVMSILVVTGFSKRGLSFILIAVAIVTLSTGIQFAVMPWVSNPTIIHYFDLTYMHGGQGAMLLPCFLLGAAAYAFRDKIPVSGILFGICASILLAMSWLLPPSIWKLTPLALIICPMLIYIVGYACMVQVPKLPLYSKGDYSYGVYLYGFPIQQTLVNVLPAAKQWAVNLTLGLFFATMFAMFSWHFIEKPVLHLRKRIRSTR